MNDIQEVGFGIDQSNQLVMNSQEIAAACGSLERAQLFRQAFASCLNEFTHKHVLNTYVFCTSEHDRNDNDGLLSMWRGYGANGNGVAIVFDTAQFNVVQGSPLIIAKVHYETTEARIAWLQQLIAKFAGLLARANVPDDKLLLPAYALFARVQLFALFTKHRGFQEEQEWRMAYMPERDAQKRLEPMFHYSIGSRGVEPKLKFKVQPIEGLTAADLSLTKITERIILGPTISSPMARAGIMRMLDVHHHPDLKPKLRASSIPFRALV